MTVFLFTVNIGWYLWGCSSLGVCLAAFLIWWLERSPRS